MCRIGIRAPIRTFVFYGNKYHWGAEMQDWKMKDQYRSKCRRWKMQHWKMKD